MSSVAVLTGVLANASRLAFRAVVASVHARAAAIDDAVYGGDHQPHHRSKSLAQSTPPCTAEVLLQQQPQQRPRRTLANHAAIASSELFPVPHGHRLGDRCEYSTIASAETSTDDCASAGKEQNKLSRCRSIHAQSGLGKDMAFGASQIMYTDRFGDDACFAVSHRQADVFGVADGVGGWRSYGYDPGTFSRALMRNCARVVESGRFAVDEPSQILSTAYEMMRVEQAAELKR